MFPFSVLYLLHRGYVICVIGCIMEYISLSKEWVLGAVYKCHFVFSIYMFSAMKHNYKNEIIIECRNNSLDFVEPLKVFQVVLLVQNRPYCF